MTFTNDYKKCIGSTGTRNVPISSHMHKELGEANDNNKINKDLEVLCDLIINIVRDLFEPICWFKNNQITRVIKTLNVLLGYLQKVENYNQYKLFSQYNTLFAIINGILSSNKNKELFNNNDETFLKRLTLMEMFNDKGYRDIPGTFYECLSSEIENSS